MYTQHPLTASLAPPAQLASVSALTMSLTSAITGPADPALALPGEILLKILSFLRVKELCEAVLVSRQWRAIVESPCLWRKVNISLNTHSKIYYFINLLIQNVYLMPGLFYNFNEFCSVQRLNQIEHLSLTDNFWKKIDKELLRDVVVSIFTKTKIRGVNIFLERDVVCQEISYEGIIQDSRYFKIIGSNYQILQTRPARIGNKYGVKYRILLMFELQRL